MVRIIRILVVMAMLVMAFATPATAAGDVPIKGTVIGAHGPPDFSAPDCPPWAVWRFPSEGVGQMSHLGRVEYSLTQCTVPEPDGSNYSEGTVMFTAANGDTLTIAQEMRSWMVGEFPEPDGFTLVGTWTVLEGTGRFANASGSGSMDGVGDIPNGEAIFDIPDGLAEFNFAGRIMYDASDRSKR